MERGGEVGIAVCHGHEPVVGAGHGGRDAYVGSAPGAEGESSLGCDGHVGVGVGEQRGGIGGYVVKRCKGVLHLASSGFNVEIEA